MFDSKAYILTLLPIVIYIGSKGYFLRLSVLKLLTPYRTDRQPTTTSNGISHGRAPQKNIYVDSLNDAVCIQFLFNTDKIHERSINARICKQRVHRATMNILLPTNPGLLILAKFIITIFQTIQTIGGREGVNIHIMLFRNVGPNCSHRLLVLIYCNRS